MIFVSRNRCRFTGKHYHHPVKCTLWWLRRKAYERGLRPAPRSLLYSARLDIVYRMFD